LALLSVTRLHLHVHRTRLSDRGMIPLSWVPVRIKPIQVKPEGAIDRFGFGTSFLFLFW